MHHALIMAGGGGTRFWPRSRARRPKQFLALAGDRTLLQMAHERLEVLAPPEHTWIMTAEAYREETASQLPTIPQAQIIGEPCRRDTAPCIGLGAALIARNDPDAVMMVTPADHVIEPVQEFRRAMQAAIALVQEHPQALATFGIPTTHPATGYGYIHRGPEVPGRLGVSAFRARAFHEKPPFDLAEKYHNSGEFFWNSGIFVWKARTLLDQLALRCPQTHDAVVRIADAWDTPARETVLREAFPTCEPISIDFAVMQRAPEVLVVQAPYRWDDVGSWLALERMHPQDANGNTVLGRHAGVDTHRCVLVADGEHLIATVGVEDLIIIQDGDVTLVAPRSREADIRTLVNKLEKEGRKEYL